MLSVKVLLLILALICFALSAVNVPASRVNLLSLGMFFWILSVIIV